MAYGAPIISIDTVFSREVLNNKYGLFFIKRKDKLLNLIKRIEKNPNLLINVALRTKWLQNNYNWDMTTQMYQTVFLDEK